MSEYDKKKEILKDILLKEEDVLAQLERIVKLAKPFVKIEEKTGRIVLASEFPFTNNEKAFLFLLGRYLAYHSGVVKETTANMSDISDGLGIVATTLSAPLGRLVRDHVVTKTQKDRYQVNPYKIEAVLKEISQKRTTVKKPVEHDLRSA
jgi:DNA-binding MarR family transcriptional regulator